MATPRLYIDAPLRQGAKLALPEAQAHYLRHVLRLGDGDVVHIFNGRDGEWQAILELAGKKGAALKAQKQLRPQDAVEDIWYLFAPLKQARLDYMAQKATEMGAAKLMPILTQNTQVSRVNAERLFANAVEAAEQCGLLNVPIIGEVRSLDALLAEWPPERRLIFCDESAGKSSPLEKLRAMRNQPCAVLIGPEGGFTEKERESLLRLPFVIPISLGPRILRADTAAVASLAMLWLARAE